MWIDPLVEEVRQRRRKLMAEFDYDPQKFLGFLKRERRKYSDRLTCPQKKKPNIKHPRWDKGAKS